MKYVYFKERVATGRFDIMVAQEDGKYPSRIGHVIGGANSWHAERGPESLGYHDTLQKAMNAVTCESRGMSYILSDMPEDEVWSHLNGSPECPKQGSTNEQLVEALVANIKSNAGFAAFCDKKGL